MKPLRSHYFILAGALLIPFSYNACKNSVTDIASVSNKIEPVSYGTSTGNPKPTQGCQQILDITCNILIQAHPELDSEFCHKGVLATSFINNLGVPAQVLNPYRSLCEAESSIVVKASQSALENCVKAIGQMDPQSALVRSAYNLSHFDPFDGVMQMIPSGESQCGKVFFNNQFPDPNFEVPAPGTVIVDFDNPVFAQATTTNLLGGIYKGLEFTAGVWNWSLPFYADTTNFAVNTASTTGDTEFNFSGGPKKLLSLSVFASKGEVELSLYDEQGQSVTQVIPADHKMHQVMTHFAKASNTIYFHHITKEPDPYRTAGLGIDDITYELPAAPPLISRVRSQYALFDRTINKVSGQFNSSNSIHNLILAQVTWRSGALQSVMDSAGNKYEPATSAVMSPGRGMQQIWYAKNIKAAVNKVTATFSGSHELSSLYIHEYSGLDLNNPLDLALTIQGENQSPDSGNFVPRSANELIFVGVLADSGWADFDSQFAPHSFFGLVPSAERVVTQAGSYQATASLVIKTGWVMQVISFRSGNQ